MQEDEVTYTPYDVYNYASDGDIDSLRLALAYGNNSTEWYRDENNGWVALHRAAVQDHIECMRELLDRGVDIETKNNNGGTALMIVVGHGHIECMHELLDRGADVDSKNNEGLSAFLIAACEGQVECMRVLLDRVADIEIKTSLNITALIIAAFQNRTECCRLLLDRGALIDEMLVGLIENLDQECKQMILDEVKHRLRRAAFDSFINHHIEHQPYIDSIYSTCYPSGDLRPATPAVGWIRAEAVRDKYYFDEILFYVHLYVANELSKNQPHKRTRSASRRCSNSQGMLASNSDTTSTLMTVIADRLKMFLQPE